MDCIKKTLQLLMLFSYSFIVHDYLRTRDWSYLTQTTRNIGFLANSGRSKLESPHTAPTRSLYENVPSQNTANNEKSFNEGYNASRLQNQVKLALYYECLCPASIQYLTDILRPVVEKLAPYLDIHLVPYGHAQTIKINKRYQFQCQHGPSECYGNRVHACAIDVIRNSTKSLLFNACLMENIKYKNMIGYDYTTALIWCGDKFNISSDEIWPCVNTRRGFILQKQYGDETHALKHLPYVPFVLINGVEDYGSENLTTVICRKLYPIPIVCRQRSISAFLNRDSNRTR